MSFTLLTCNVLADSYIRRGWYTLTPDRWLEPQIRHPALARQLVAMNCDILCLQEVEGKMYTTLSSRLDQAGHRGAFIRKGGAKPDGCATFWRESEFEPLAARRLDYADGGVRGVTSGHVAQLTVLCRNGRRLGIANTHLKWDSPDTPVEARYGLAQIEQLLSACATMQPACDGWILCGDFNVTPESPVIGALRAAHFEFAHHTHPEAYTAAPNRVPRVIDYLFYNRALAAAPVKPPAISADTPLPGPDHPSDHLPLASSFDWA